jgi:hypothetical protein
MIMPVDRLISLLQPKCLQHIIKVNNRSLSGIYDTFTSATTISHGLKFLHCVDFMFLLKDCCHALQLQYFTPPHSSREEDITIMIVTRLPTAAVT